MFTIRLPGCHMGGVLAAGILLGVGLAQACQGNDSPEPDGPKPAGGEAAIDGDEMQNDPMQNDEADDEALNDEYKEVRADTGQVFTPAQLRHGFASGERLKALLYEGPDGARTWAGWRDTQLETNCVFRAAPDGVTRCVPDIAALQTFLDDACTERAASVVEYGPVGRRPLEAGDMLRLASPDQLGRHGPTAVDGDVGLGCGVAENAVFRVAGKAERGPLFAKNRQGACVSFLELALLERTYRLDTEVDPSGFVKADLAHVPIDEALAIEVAVAEDGAWRSLAPRLALSKKRCDVHVLDDGTLRCVDSASNVESYTKFRDASCQQPVRDAAIGCGVAETPTRSVELLGREDCEPARHAVREIGDQVEPPLFEDNGDTCVSYQPSALSGSITFEQNPDVYASLSERLPPDTFPRISKRWRGPGRLRTGYLATADGYPLLPMHQHAAYRIEGRAAFRDDDLDFGCRPQPSPDRRALLCGPPGKSQTPPAPSSFADAECRTPLSGSACSDGIVMRGGEAYLPKEPHEGPTYGIFSNMCESYTPSNPTFETAKIELATMSLKIDGVADSDLFPPPDAE